MKTLLTLFTLAFASLASAQVSLTFTDNSDNETGFEIERRVGASATWQKVADLAENVTKWQDMNVLPETQYHYRVCAWNDYGRSGYTPTGTITTEPKSEAPNTPLEMELGEEEKPKYVPRPVVQFGLMNFNTTTTANP